MATDVNLKTKQRSSNLPCHCDALHARMCQYKASFKDRNSFQILKFTGKTKQIKTANNQLWMDPHSTKSNDDCQ